jgi:diguanylate cyclase
MELMLERLSESVASAESLEQLARPLLEMLELITGLESLYLTSIDEEADLQSVDYVRNAGELFIPEGLSVPWSDTLCKRCLDEVRRFTSNANEIWGDSQTARDLGIQTYASAPIRASNGSVIGTLCGASKHSQPLGPQTFSALNVFSKLIGQHVERERLLKELRRSNEYLTNFALTDSLTSLPNRRALHSELGRLLARAARDGSYVIVGIIDLDDFKRINDSYGHVSGDQFLIECAKRLAGIVRDTDMLARIGGDEFALVAPGPVAEEQAHSVADQWQRRASEVTRGLYALAGRTVDYAGVSAGVIAVRRVSVDQALELADAAMYREKRLRKRSGPHVAK